MARVTNTAKSGNYEKIESGVEIHISPNLAKPGGSLYVVDSKTSHDWDATGEFMFLGHFSRYKAYADEENPNSYFTSIFEYANQNAILFRKGKDGKTVKIFEGCPVDEAFKKEITFVKARYSCTVMLINQKGSLCFLQVRGSNLDSYFDFIKANPGCDYIKINGQSEMENPKKKGEKIFTLDFFPISILQTGKGYDEKAVAEKIENLTMWCDEKLRFARTGTWDKSESEKPETEAPQAPEKPEVKTVPGTGGMVKQSGDDNEIPEGAITGDDDLPF